MGVATPTDRPNSMPLDQVKVTSDADSVGSAAALIAERFGYIRFAEQPDLRSLKKNPLGSRSPAFLDSVHSNVLNGSQCESGAHR